MSGCALTLDKILPDTQNNQIVNFEIYFQAFFSDNLKRIFDEKLGTDFGWSNVKSIDFFLDFNGKNIRVKIKSDGILIKPLLTIEKSNFNVNLVATVTYTLTDGIDEKKVSISTNLDKFFDLSDKDNLYFIVYLIDKGTDVKLSMEDLFNVKKVDIGKENKIYYITPDNQRYYSVYNGIAGEIKISSEIGEVQVFSYP
ncbi:hypothetical protein Tmel_1552 [Thermosipho melanesiensis BI429]|uniref:Uncharacterized protein n=1 Tax=Thermosipho melanesiensis (strain DSM 12029 / CIP 104789 / BI429) TaxID=391009 RepID=A6LN96_THEM4|nr:hypothetical protein Tmel_1552 [Thermosipho melanesiensis BI429]